MFTVFDLIRLLAMLLGAVVLGVFGWHKLGVIGTLLGVPVGLVVGGMLGQLPLIVLLKSMSRRFEKMTNDELLAELHDPTCFTPNVHLLELNRRGYEIRRELPYIHSLRTSTESHRRTAGWAALTSVFPELVDLIDGYNPTASTVECQTRCKALLETCDRLM
jgi:hypothetical protein